MPPVFVSNLAHFVYEKPVFRLHMKEPMTKLENPVLMATIGGAQGLRGEVRAKAYTADPSALGDYGHLHSMDGRSFEDNVDEGPDFTAVSPGELRNYARQSFDSGLIDQNTYAAISEPLPMHAIDPLGNVIDLSSVTDGTSFNFLDYYKNQLQVAMSIGDPNEVQTLKSIVNFLDG